LEDWQNLKQEEWTPNLLDKIEEMALVEWCFTMQKIALYVTLNMLKCTIQTILKNALGTHPFKNGIPR
jgi:hypothetical protein